jgi:lipoyl(octanoyl) transferase
MPQDAGTTRGHPDAGLQVYLLGTVEFEAALRFQRRLQYDVSGDRSRAALILCEHPPLITIGRHGSRAHVRYESEELRARQWSLRWVNRGGGALLHLTGQLAIYPILPLDRLGLDVPTYLQRLGSAVHDLLDDFSIHSQIRASAGGVWVGDRLIAAIGVAVRDWVSSYGAYLNVHPTLDPFRQIVSGPGTAEPMTSLARERRGLVRPALVRERLIEHFAARFGFGRVALFSDHPSLQGAVERCQTDAPRAAGKPAG